MSVRRRRSERQLAEELDALRQLQLATFGLTSETDIHALLDGILAAAIEISEADFGAIHLIEESTRNIKLKAARGLPPAYAKQFSDLWPGYAPCGVAIEKGERVVVFDVETDSIFRKRELRKTMLEAKIHSCQSTPLRATSGRVVGALTTHYRSHGMPPARGMRLLDLLARHAADLIEKARHREELESLVSERTDELQDMNRRLHDLSGRLLHAQDLERRRIARDLHDTTAQQIAFIAMSLGQLSRKLDDPKVNLRQVISEDAEMARKALEELRTLSYLLHPPLLDEVGLRSAVCVYASGFEKRSGIHVEILIPERFPRLFHDVELCLFRVIQEALTNVHRYSGSKTARIEIAATQKIIELSIEDRGRGMIATSGRESGEKLGVGIPGMRERLRQFGGTLSIESGDRGTRIVARVPLRAALRSAK